MSVEIRQPSDKGNADIQLTANKSNYIKNSTINHQIVFNMPEIMQLNKLCIKQDTQHGHCEEERTFHQTLK